jgi:eukaryotic-like serine/threonine-protein kinase
MGDAVLTTDGVLGCLLGRKIADGASGEIYEAQDLKTQKFVVVKILQPRHHEKKTEIRRLFTEGSFGLRLRHHEHIVRTLRMGDVDGIPFVVMEHAPGRSLREILRERCLHDGELLRLTVAMAKALQYMHDLGIYHKDIKPDNIMIDHVSGSIKLLDLGFAETRLSATLTFFGRTLEGSPAYMAPEMILDRRASPATDIYSLGCTLYEAATGSVPFPGLSDHEVMAKQTNLKLRPPAIVEINHDVSFLTQKIILTALEKKVTFRYRSADEIWLELARHPSVQYGFVSM